MIFEWDKNKATANLKKHGIDFADVTLVLYDQNAVTIEDPSYDEERFITVGMDGYGRILVVVYTYREDSIRIVSARKANNHESKQYRS
ncbi:MAG: BrnT family toxin [Proteobacteria bacterium]|nr:BrnT family toxin [Pseudomonadota bacterium]